MIGCAYVCDEDVGSHYVYLLSETRAGTCSVGLDVGFEFDKNGNWSAQTRIASKSNYFVSRGK